MSTVPPFHEPGFTIGTTVIDGRAYAFAQCNPCHHYAYHIRPCVKSSLGDYFRSIDLAVLMLHAAARECPDFVTAAMKEYGEKK